MCAAANACLLVVVSAALRMDAGRASNPPNLLAVLLSNDGRLLRVAVCARRCLKVIEHWAAARSPARRDARRAHHGQPATAVLPRSRADAPTGCLARSVTRAIMGV
jgi:hypothetical protein